MGSEWVKIVENTYFTNFILFAILWSSIMLAMETPTFPAEGSNAATAFLAIDITFTIVFTIEMVPQWMALGLGGYFKQLANRLDFIIVFTAWLSLILEWSGVDANTLTGSEVCACSASFAPSARCGASPRSGWSSTAPSTHSPPSSGSWSWACSSP